MGLPIITGIISTLGKILPGGATKAGGWTGGIAAIAASITMVIEPVNELTAAIHTLTLAVTVLFGAIAAALLPFGVGRKAGSQREYLYAKDKRS